MTDWIFLPPTAIAGVLVSVILTYLGLVALTRIFGIRSFSKMSGFDFAVTVAFGSILASIVMAKDPPVLQGLLALTSLFVIQFIFATARRQWTWFNQMTGNSARLIMARGVINDVQLKKAKMTRGDLIAKLREANALNFDEVEAVIAETTGDVSVLHQTGGDLTIDPKVLEGVVDKEFYLKRLKAD
ncbi:DUF421 domain-containing protein [Litorimonas sp. RW-G-Af-16]|uniref:DUF421 domain-containing protein n=1 Tax=Litorimonas sp. RW-G-Af-16 TaxID=3241168 RepID=UPI00390CAE9B